MAKAPIKPTKPTKGKMKRGEMPVTPGGLGAGSLAADLSKLSKAQKLDAATRRLVAMLKEQGASAKEIAKVLKMGIK